jgi:hypothetical protein
MWGTRYSIRGGRGGLYSLFCIDIILSNSAQPALWIIGCNHGKVLEMAYALIAFLGRNKRGDTGYFREIRWGGRGGEERAMRKEGES